jgi:hypothetical protein
VTHLFRSVAAIVVVTGALAATPAPPPISHPAPPIYHPAPPTRPPVSHPAPPGGFSFPRDVYPPHPPMQQPPGHIAPPVPRRVVPPPPMRTYPPKAPYPTGPYRYWHGPVTDNPHRWHDWGWNRGVIWYPVWVYWGGGFWGPWILNTTTIALYGSIVDYDDRQIYASYLVGPSSPGAQLLEDYGLTQTACGPPNLVVIWGPGNSVVCAYPNDLVSPGNYELDPATLTLRALNEPQ